MSTTTDNPQNNLLTPKRAAEILNVHPETLRRLADSGQLPTTKTPGGHRRYRLNDLRRQRAASSDRLYLRILIIDEEQELLEMFNDDDLPPENWLRGEELASHVADEMAAFPGDLGQWIEDNFQFHCSVYINQPEKMLWAGEIPGDPVHSAGQPAIEISTSTPIDLGQEFAVDNSEELLELINYDLDFDSNSLWDIFRRNGLFTAPAVRFYHPSRQELSALLRIYCH